MEDFHETGAVPHGAQRTAVLCIDLQNDFCHPEGAFARHGLVMEDRSRLVDNVNRLTAVARTAGLPVIWVQMVYESEADVGILATRGPGIANSALRYGTWGAAVLSDLDIGEGDLFVRKTRFSAFYRTELEEILQRLTIGRLLVCGVRTDFCVESTVRDAFFRDLDVCVVKDAVATYGEHLRDLHEHSLREMGTVFADVRDTKDVCQEIALATAQRVR